MQTPIPEFPLSPTINSRIALLESVWPTLSGVLVDAQGWVYGKPIHFNREAGFIIMQITRSEKVRHVAIGTHCINAFEWG